MGMFGDIAQEVMVDDLIVHFKKLLKTKKNVKVKSIIKFLKKYKENNIG